MINPNRSTSTCRLFVSTLRMCCVLVMIGASALCWDSFVAVKAKSPSYALSLPASGSLTANPSPIQVCDGSGLGVTTLSWTSTGTSAVEVHLDEPTGMLVAATGPSGTVTTGKWVGNATQFFLQDVSGGLPLSPENTLTTVTVYLTGCSSPGDQWTTSGNNIKNTNTGNVGIGTTVPGFKLDVQGGEINSAGGLCIAGDCKSAWSQVGGGGSSQWTTAGSNISFTTGNVGVGTGSPGARLDIGGGNLRVQSGTLDLNNQIRDDSINLWGGIYTLGIRDWTFVARTNQKFRFESALSNSTLSAYELGSTAGATFFAVKNDGNVGIGTPLPAAPLHISSANNPNLLVDAYSTGSNVRFRRAGGTPSAPTAVQNGDVLGNFNFTGYGTTGFSTGGRVIWQALAAENWTDTAQGAYVVIHTTATGSALSSERMRITSAGNVGIGTPATNFKLDVNGEINATGFRINGTPFSPGGTWAQVDKTISSLGDLQTRSAGDLNAGTVPIARLGVSGIPDATTFLRGDNTWATVTGGSSQWASGTNNISYNSGNVGIGTTTPERKLHLATSAQSLDGVYLTSSDGHFALTVPSLCQGCYNGVTQAGDTGIIYSHGTVGTGSFVIAPWGANFGLRMDSNGNVGIGTTNPAVKLEVGTNGTESGVRIVGTGGVRLDLYSTNANAGARNWTNRIDNIVFGDFGIYQSGTKGGDAFGGVPRFYIKNDGNVGIGTTTPTFKLDVNGEINATGFRINNVPISTGGPGAVSSVFGRTGAVAQQAGDYTWAQITKTSSSLGDLTTRSAGDLNAGTVPIARLGVSGIPDATTFLRGDNTWATVTGGPSQWATTPGTNKISYNSGNVGIGISNPLYSLDVNGGVNGFRAKAATTSSNDTISTFENANGIQAIVRGNGNVGIGTTSPGYKLDVAGEIRSSTGGFVFPNGSVQTTAAGGAQSIFQNIANGSGTTQFSAGSINDSLRFEGTGGTSVSFDANNKKVIINSSTSSSTSSAPNVAAGQFGQFTGGGDYSFPANVAVTGNVGIGTTTPGARLTVQGPVPSATTDILRLLPGGTFNNTSIFNVSSIDTANGARAGTRVSIYGDNAGSAGSLVFDWFNPASGNQGLFSGPNGITFQTNAVVTGGSPRAFTFRSVDLSVFGGPNAVLAVQNTSGSDLFLVQQGGNVGIGTSTPTAKLDVVGSVNASGNMNAVGTITGGNIVAKYQDVAEWVESSQELSAGTLVVLDHTKSNQVIASSQAYDTRVAGVISEWPGIALGEAGDKKVLVATTGRVWLTVDASKGPIQIGDLLVTSDIRGVAMKSEAINVGGVQIHRPGTLIGKALEPLAKGQGKILVLLSLQ